MPCAKLEFCVWDINHKCVEPTYIMTVYVRGLHWLHKFLKGFYVFPSDFCCCWHGELAKKKKDLVNISLAINFSFNQLIQLLNVLFEKE